MEGSESLLGLPPPPGGVSVDVRDHGGELETTVSVARDRFLGCMGFLGSLLLVGMGLPFVDRAPLFAIVLALPFTPVAYFWLGRLVNRVRFRASTMLVVSERPVPWPGVAVPIGEIQSFVVTERRRRGRPGPASITAQMAGGGRREIVSALPDVATATYVVRALEAHRRMRAGAPRP